MNVCKIGERPHFSKKGERPLFYLFRLLAAEHRCAVVQGQAASEDAGVVIIAGGTGAGDPNSGTDGQVFFLPARPDQTVGIGARAALPLLDFPGGVGNIQVIPDMGICPVNIRQGAAQFELYTGIEFTLDGMVGNGLGLAIKQGDCRNQDF